jgi:hypothetical protein
MNDKYSCADIMGPASINEIMFDRFDSLHDSEHQKVRVLVELDLGSAYCLSFRNSPI